MPEVIELRRAAGIPDNAAVIGVIARLRKVKGHEVLLRSLPLLHNSSEIHLAVVGDGPERTALQELARTLGLSKRVHFVGQHFDIAPWYAMSYVVAVPSLQEAFSLAALEAMAASRPIVASRVGGIPELLEDGISALLVTPGEPAGLAAALELALGNQALAAKLGQAGRRTYEERFTIEQMMAGWLRCIEVCDLCEESSNQPLHVRAKAAVQVQVALAHALDGEVALCRVARGFSEAVAQVGR